MAAGTDQIRLPSYGSFRGFDDYRRCLGDEMRGRRATMGKSLLDVQRDLGIRPYMVVAIENADPDAFEASWLIAGHVKSYARYLGLDPDTVYERFCRECDYEGAQQSLQAARFGPGRKKPGKKKSPQTWQRAEAARRVAGSKSLLSSGRSIFMSVGSAVALIGVIFGVTYLGWTVYQELEEVRLSRTAQEPVIPVPDNKAQGAGDENMLAALPDQSDALGQWVSSQLEGSGDGPIGEITPGSTGVFAATGVAVEMTEDEAPADIWPEAVETVQVEETEPAQFEEIVIARKEPDSVVLVPIRPVWVRVTSGNGTVLLEKILDSAEEYEVPESQGQLWLRAGNSGSLYFVVGGDVFGPAGTGTRVAKDVDLAADSIRGTFEHVMNDLIPQEIKSLTRFTQVNQANQ